MAGSSSPVIMSWSFWQPAPILKLFGGYAKVVSEPNLSDTPITQEFQGI